MFQTGLYTLLQRTPQAVQADAQSVERNLQALGQLFAVIDLGLFVLLIVLNDQVALMRGQVQETAFQTGIKLRLFLRRSALWFRQLFGQSFPALFEVIQVNAMAAV